MIGATEDIVFCSATSKTKPCCVLLSASGSVSQLIGEGVAIGAEAAGQNTKLSVVDDGMGPQESEGFREVRDADMPCKPVKAAADTVLKTAC